MRALAFEVLAGAVCVSSFARIAVAEQRFVNEIGYETTYTFDVHSIAYALVALVVLETSIARRVGAGQDDALVHHAIAAMLWMPLGAVAGLWLLRIDAPTKLIACAAGAAMARVYAYSYFIYGGDDEEEGDGDDGGGGGGDGDGGK